jgi:4'-phosphopantetheinyl transferase
VYDPAALAGTVDVRVHIAAVADAHAPAARDRYLALLTDDERARHARLAREASRDQLLVGRALARHALSRARPVPPEAWRFEAGRHGRPEVSAPAPGPAEARLRFNLSHAAGLVVCAVAEEVDVGVDIEGLDPRRPCQALAARFFAPPEAAAVDALDGDRQRACFFALWTLKEAYLKARGLGLSIALDRFWFQLAPDAPPAIAFAPGFDDDPQAWRFVQRHLGADHVLAVAVRTGGRPARVSVESWGAAA